MTFINTSPPPAGGGGGGSENAPAPLTYGALSMTTSTVTRYLYPAGGWGTGTADTDEKGITLQSDVTLKRLEIVIRAGAGNGEDVDYTVNLDGVNTGLTISIPSTSAGSFIVDVNVAGAAGQKVSIELAKLLSIGGASPQDIQAFVTHDGGTGGAAIPPLTNLVYVAKNGNDVSADGSIAKPYLTIGAAYASIGDAADNAEWNDATKRFWQVIVAPGVYIEVSVALPVRPSVWTYLYGASIDGDVTLLFPNGLITSGIISPQWGFRGNGRRAVFDDSGDHTINGIVGSWQSVMGTGQPAGFFPQFHLIETGVTVDVECSGTFSGAQLFMEDSVVGRNIQNSGDSYSVWANGTNNETAGDIEGIGGVGGNVSLFSLNDVLLKNASPLNPTVVGWRWTNVRFEDSGNFEFQFCAGVDLMMDEPTFVDYEIATEIATGEGFPLDVLSIAGGDPWKQVVEVPPPPIIIAGPAARAVLGGLSITGLVAGNYHLMFNADTSITGEDVLVSFDIAKNTVKIPGTLRSLGRGDIGGGGGDSNTNPVTSTIIAVALVPGDTLAVYVDAAFNVDTAIIGEMVFMAIKVGSEILMEIGP